MLKRNRQQEMIKFMPEINEIKNKQQKQVSMKQCVDSLRKLTRLSNLQAD